MAGKIVTKAELCAIIAKDPKTITIWQNEGMPYLPAGPGKRDNEYNTAEVIRWMIKRETKEGMDVDQERAHLARAQTEAARLRNEEKRGNLISLDAVVAVLQRATFALRQCIVNYPMPEELRRQIIERIHALGKLNVKDIREEASEEDVEAEEPA